MCLGHKQKSPSDVLFFVGMLWRETYAETGTYVIAWKSLNVGPLSCSHVILLGAPIRAPKVGPAADNPRSMLPWTVPQVATRYSVIRRVCPPLRQPVDMNYLKILGSHLDTTR